MEKSHRNKLRKQFRASMNNQTIVALGIMDHYEYMSVGLVGLFEKLVPPHLGMAAK
jgi:predicted protein tyrosine phosphatase